jgi:hypothetical protein
MADAGADDSVLFRNERYVSFEDDEAPEDVPAADGADGSQVRTCGRSVVREALPGGADV